MRTQWAAHGIVAILSLLPALSCHAAEVQTASVASGTGIEATFLVPEHRKLIVPFAGKTLPVPPRQAATWLPKQDDVLSEATAAVFKAGMADPRGLEYRTVSFVTGSSTSGVVGTQLTTTHGWLLPEVPQETTRFAVAWNGLVYPVIKVGEAASLRDDILKVVPRKNPYLTEPAWAEATTVASESFTSLKIPLLLRLGEDEAARLMWRTAQSTLRTDENQLKPTDIAAQWVQDWQWGLFSRALGAHARGDDHLALLDFRVLASIFEAEKNLSKKNQYERAGLLWQVPLLLADQERRAREEQRTKQDVAAPAAKDDVAIRVHDLENVQATQWRQPGGVILADDWRVQRLIRMGDAAVPLLLDTLENDQRYTRSIEYHRDFARSRHVLTVAEAAFVALQGIFGASGESFGWRSELSNEKTRHEIVTKMRAHWENYGRIPAAERPLQILLDDQAAPPKWLDAAREITRPLNEERYANLTIKSQSTNSTLAGEALRTRVNPSVNDILQRRVLQVTRTALGAPEPENAVRSLWTAIGLAQAFGDWDVNAAAPFLGALLEQYRTFETTASGAQRQEFNNVVREAQLQFWRRRIRSTSPAAQRSGHRDYAAWLARQSLGAVDLRFFRPMWLHQNEPAFQEAAKTLFSSPQASWGRLMREPVNGTYPSSEAVRLLDSPLLTFPAFRQMVERELKNETRAGLFHIKAEGQVAIDVDAGWSTGVVIPAAERAAYPVGHSGEFRVCDLVGFYLREKQDDGLRHSRVQLYWPLEKRNIAVAQTLRRLQAGTLQFEEHSYLSH